MKPTSADTYERARRLANTSLLAIDLQFHRLSSPEPQDSVFILRKWTDFDFLIVCLTRLRRAGKLAASIPEIKTLLAPALKEFDKALPHLKRLRDIAEHVDDYAVDKGRDSSIKRQKLEFSSIGEESLGLTLTWLDAQLNSYEALKASQKLFEVIHEASNTFKTNTPQ